MSAQMNSLFESAEVAFEPLLADRLDEVMRIEQQAYAHPWSRTNFLDALHSGYQGQMLVADGEVLGYFVAMLGVDEVHLLNLTVSPRYQQQGWAKVLLEALSIWARAQNAKWLWLEVRTGNDRALRVYEAAGFRRMGLRKAYYPAGHGQREDALVMSRRL
jgi:ribosomal-protein-alanine N-acetyltransferase